MSIKLNFKYTEMNWNTCFLPLKRFIRRDGENIKHWCLSFSCWFTGKFSASLPGSDSEGSDHRQKLTAKTDISISSCCCLVFLSTPMSHKSCLNVVIVSYRHGCLKKKKKKTRSKPPLHFSSSPTSSHSLSLSPWYYATAYVTQRPHRERRVSGWRRRGGFKRNAVL